MRNLSKFVRSLSIFMFANAVFSGSGFGFRSEQPTGRLHSGQKQKQENSYSAFRVVRPQLTTGLAEKNSKLGRSMEKSIDSTTGATRIVTGIFNDVGISKSMANGLAATDLAIQNFVRSHSEVFGDLTHWQLHLDQSALIWNSKEQYLKYRLSYDQVPVEDASIDVRAKFGQVSQLVNMSFSEALPTQAKLSANDWQATALFEDVRRTEKNWRVSSERGHYVLVPVQSFLVRMGDEPYRLQVDLRDGSVYELRPMRVHAAGVVNGQIFPRYYKDSLVTAAFPHLKVYIDPEFTKFETSNAAGEFNVDAALTPGVKGLSGPFVNVASEKGDLIQRQSQMNEGRHELFLNKKSDAAAHADADVAQNMAFYHTNLMVAYAKNFLSNPWLQKPLSANANLTRTCNAHWDRLDQTINFYSADDECANSALISDVIYHEWGHGLDDNTGGIEDGAYSEGFGDTMSMLMTRSNVLGIGFFIDGKFIRDLSPDKIYPQDQGEVHAEGLIIGSTYYDLYQLLAKKYGDDQAIAKVSSYAFRAIVMAARYTDVYNAVLVVDDNDNNLNNGTPNFCMINSVFAAHGLAEIHSRCLLGQLRTSFVAEVQGNRNGVIEPGETVELSSLLHNNTDEDLDQLQGQMSIESRSQGISLATPDIVWAHVARGATVAANSPVIVNIGSEVACGSTFALHTILRTAEKEAHADQKFTVGKLVSQPTSMEASGLPKPVVDFEEVDLPFAMGDASWNDETKFQAFHLEFSIKHSYMSDVTVSLVTPAGKVIEVQKGSGLNGTFTFSKDITNLVEKEAAKGEWKVRVEDQFFGDTGEILSVKIVATPGLFVCQR